MPGSASIEILRKKKTPFSCVFDLMRNALNSSVVWVLATEGDRLFQCGIVRQSGGGGGLQATLYVWSTM